MREKTKEETKQESKFIDAKKRLMVTRKKASWQGIK